MFSMDHLREISVNQVIFQLFFKLNNTAFIRQLLK